jgi:integration host factor subunit alpha
VQITGFGTFLVRQKRERRGRNPQTGEEMLIQPRRSVVFRPSKLFGGDGEGEPEQAAAPQDLASS